MLRLEVITEIDRLIAIKESWSRLQEQLDYVTPFQTPEWLLTWWHHFGSGDPRVFVFKSSNDHIVGVLPAFLHEWQGKRQLTLIGSGLSDFLEPAFVPEVAHKAICCLWEYLDDSAEWEICNLQDLSADTLLADCTAVHSWEVSSIADIPCSEIPINDQFAAFWEKRPAGLRRNVRRYRDKADQTGRVEIGITEAGNAECLDALIRLHSARWREQGKPGMIAASRSAEFLRDITKTFEEQHRLVFFSLRFQGGLAAVILAFPYRRTLYAYLSAFDPAYAALGFGRTLLYAALEHAFSNGYRAWNFLRGNEPYKVDWGAHTIPKARLIIRREPQLGRN